VAKSKKTPEQKRRAEIRLEVKRLLLKRPEVLNEIQTLKESLDPKSIAQDKRAEKSQVLKDIKWFESAENSELDKHSWVYIWHPIDNQSKWRRTGYWQQNCIWFGVQVERNEVHPVRGSFGFSIKRNAFKEIFNVKPLRITEPCLEERLPFDFYCSTHRDEADEVLRNSSGSEQFIDSKNYLKNYKFYENFCAGVNIFPRSKPKPYVIRRKILKEIESNLGNVANEVRERRELLEEAKDVLKQIDDSLAFYRDELTNLESHLSRRRLPENARLAIFEKYNFKCAMCNVPLTLVTPHIDHIKPLAKGGKNEESNYQPLCETCNLRKGAKYEE
jgi:5-methylcytosine-specific restriction endonuclease McrA